MGYIIFCFFEAIVGILLLINPFGFTAGIIIAVGAGLCLCGLISIINYFRVSVAEGMHGQLLMKGLVLLLAGLFCVLRPNWFVMTFPILSILYGVSILVTGLGKVQNAVDLLRMKNKKWFLAAIGAAIAIICGIVIMNNPFSSAAVLWMFTGVSLIVGAVVDAITVIVTKVKGKNGPDQSTESML